MKRAAFIAALLAAAAVAYGRELPVQRDLVRPMEFGAGAVPEDLRAAPDVAMAIQRREEFAREMKGGGKKGFLARGERRASGSAAAYYGGMSGDDEEGRPAAKKDDWLVRSVTDGAFGNSETNKNAVESVLSQDNEDSDESPWGWLAAEVERREKEEAPPEPQEEETSGVEGAPSATEIDIPSTVAVAGNSVEERDARRDEIRNAPMPTAPPSFAEVRVDSEEIRSQWTLDLPETSVTRTMPDPTLGGGIEYGRATKAEFEYSSSSGGFGIPSVDSGGGAVRFETSAWGAGRDATGGGQWGRSSDASWGPLQLSGSEGSTDLVIPTGDSQKKPDPMRTGTPGSGTMPW